MTYKDSTEARQLCLESRIKELEEENEKLKKQKNATDIAELRGEVVSATKGKAPKTVYIQLLIGGVTTLWLETDREFTKTNLYPGMLISLKIQKA